jgi:two-component system response regulator NreC
VGAVAADAYFPYMPVNLMPAPPESDRAVGPGVATEAIAVVLADDHPLMRSRLRSVLEQDGLFQVIADTPDLGEAVRQVFRAHPSVLVLDLSMPTGSSIEAIRRLRKQAPDTQIVVLQMDASAGFARLAFDAGAIGYVLKDTADGELAEAVASAARGERYISPRVVGSLGG